jgi:hypothetical protein
VGYAIAAAIAIPVGFLDQFARLKARPTFGGGTLLWWVGRILLECGIAAGALFLAKQLDVKYSDDWYGWVAAGVLGASLAKSHITEIAHGDRAAAYGLINLYEQVRRIFEHQIDDSSATRQSAWIEDTILPAVAGLKPSEVADRLEHYVEGRGELSEIERGQELSWIDGWRNDALDEQAVRKALVLRAVKLRAWRLLNDLAKAGSG